LRRCIDTNHKQLNIVRQCELLGLARSTFYHEPIGETAENLALMKRIDQQYLQTPFYGSRKMAIELGINRKRAQRLMRRMGLETIYRKRATSRALDNVLVERLWRSVKYEEVYLKDYADGWQAEQSLADYFEFYCQRRIHQALDYRTPAAVYRNAKN
jgi:hypothetical protein